MRELLNDWIIISENQERNSAEYLFIKILCGKQLTQGVHF